MIVASIRTAAASPTPPEERGGSSTRSKNVVTRRWYSSGGAWVPPMCLELGTSQISFGSGATARCVTCTFRRGRRSLCRAIAVLSAGRQSRRHNRRTLRRLFVLEAW
jgi:hypothetical protein